MSSHPPSYEPKLCVSVCESDGPAFGFLLINHSTIDPKRHTAGSDWNTIRSRKGVFLTTILPFLVAGSHAWPWQQG